ncbi:MAG: methionyl-tRNA formyltransferase [Lautropia sp.]
MNDAALRIVFAGTPAFAATALDAILAADLDVVGVLTRPDRPAGRGQRLVASPVKQLALAHGIVVLQPETLRDPAAVAEVARFGADVIVVAAYGMILPPAVLALPRFGCLNIHASLLPRWRGAAPIQRAIEAGDAVTGVCIMQMEAGLDTGPVCERVETPIRPIDTAATLHDRLAELGAAAIVSALGRLRRPGLSFVAQPVDGVTYAHKLAKSEAVIDWRRAAVEIDRQLRAFDPAPGSTASLVREPQTALRLLAPRIPAAASPVGDHAPGTVLAVAADGVTIACGDGAIVVGDWQRPGGRRLPAREFLAGFPIAPGDRFALPAPAPAASGPSG